MQIAGCEGDRQMKTRSYPRLQKVAVAVRLFDVFVSGPYPHATYGLTISEDDNLWAQNIMMWRVMARINPYKANN